MDYTKEDVTAEAKEAALWAYDYFYAHFDKAGTEINRCMSLWRKDKTRELGHIAQQVESEFEEGN